MSFATPLKCDICDTTGYASPEWMELRNFAYVKHACPICVSNTDSYGGSEMVKERLKQQILRRN